MADTYQFRAAGVIVEGAAVMITKAGVVDHTAAATSKPIGMALNAAAAAGDIVTVQLNGISPATGLATAAIAPGAIVTGDADGTLTSVGNTAATIYGCLGKALDAAAGAGSYIRVLIQPHTQGKPEAA